MNPTRTSQVSATEKLLRVALALAIALSGVLATLSAAAQEAFAAEAILVDTGTNFDFYQTDHKTGLHWADSRFKLNGEDAYCIQITDGAHAGAAYTSRSMDPGMALKIGLYKQYLKKTYPDWSVMKRSGYLQYMIWWEYTPEYMNDNVTPDNDDFYDVYDAAKAHYKQHRDEYEASGTEWTSIDSQNMCVAPELTPKGAIALTKTSGIRQLTDENGCYTLKGAAYTVYSDKGLTKEVGTITTDTDGKGKLERVTSGTYWVKETQRSEGYSLDEHAYKVKVEAGETARLNGSEGSVEIPQSDPVGILLGKVDATTNGSEPEGAATLADAQFSVKYYDGFYANAGEAEKSGDPTRSWTFKTDGDGFSYYSDEYKVSGAELYRQTGGEAALPLGTVVIEETKAPTGYNLDNGKGGKPERLCIQITSDGAVGESVYTYNSPTQPDTVKRGDFRLVKEVPLSIDDEKDNPQEVERVLVPGVQFQIINDNDNAVVSPTTGKQVAKGGVVCTITTDDNGLATTKSLELPEGWTGALAYGTYTVHEVIPDDVAADFKAENGKDLIAVPDWKESISEEGQYDAPQLVNNHIPQTPLKVIKVDAETGKRIPLECSFQLTDSEGELVTYTSQYPEEATLDTWTTNANGEVTLPMLLEEGTYTISEVLAPQGYVLNLEGEQFTVGSVYNGWDNPITVNFEDMPQKGIIKVAKHDSTNGEAVPDSTYVVKAASTIMTPDGTVRAHEGEIVATLVTDENGEASTPELYLGSYTVCEAKAKDGYALNVDEETVALEYQGQEVDVFTHDEPVTDTPTEIVLHKVDAIDNDVPVAGATFHAWNDEGTYDEELVSDENGFISIKYVKHGSYHVQETAAPEGYVINDVGEDGNAKIHDFTVNDQGMISFDGSEDMVDVFEWTVENMPKAMKTTAIDKNSGTHEGQARDNMSIIDTVAYTGCIPGKEYAVTGTLMDKATGEKALDADGKEITATKTFTAEEFEGTVDIAFEFDGADLSGHDLVAFENMDHEGKEYMTHADINDEGQTVKVVDVHTTATNPETGDNLGNTAETLELVDEVAYQNLTVGNTYKLVTTLYDSEEGREIIDADGNVVSVETEFAPEAKDGTVDVPMKVATDGIAGHTLVFFERLLESEGNTIAAHADAEDEGQSIHFADIHTKAVDADDGDKNVIADESAQVTDAVSYENLVSGKEYVVTGKLMDKKTGEPLKDADGKEIVSTATFTPEKSEGTVDVTFEFDGSKLGGTTAVAFETLIRNGVEIAVHADIDDADQTVDLDASDEGTPGKGYPKTGGEVPVAPIAASIIVLVGCGAAGAAYALGKRCKADAGKSDDESESEE